MEPQHPVLFLPNDPDKFIWQSEADGYNHLYLYDTTGKELRKLTGGEWVVTKVLGFSKDGNKVIFEGTAPPSRISEYARNGDATLYLGDGFENG